MARPIIRTALITAALTLAGQAASARAEGPKLVATIPPLAGIASDILSGVAEPTLLIDNGGSPHAYSLRPSDARALTNADYVLWVGEGLELFLADKLDTLAPSATEIEAMNLPGMTLMPYRKAEEHHHEHDEHADHDDHDDHDHDHADHDEDHHAEHEHDDHDHEEHAHGDHDDHDEHEHGEHEHGEPDHAEHDHDHHGHHHTGNDAHVWLSPDNAVAIARGIAAAVSKDLPAAEAARVSSNLANFESDIAELKRVIAAQLKPYAERPYLTFHDAYQYFETGFGLDYHGSVTVSPEVQPGAATLSELREEIEEHDIVCIFSEPQFEPRAIRVIAENLPVRTGVLDPLGDSDTARIGGYQALLTGLADSYTDCLGQ